MQSSLIIGLIASVFCIQSAWAHEEESDIYSQCVDKVIKQQKLPGINNMVVDACSNEAVGIYQKQIVKLLDRIKQQSQTFAQPERYQKIMKSQQLWKAYVDQECSNAGDFIGSPMYGFCPMEEYSLRVKQLSQYADD